MSKKKNMNIFQPIHPKNSKNPLKNSPIWVKFVQFTDRDILYNELNMLLHPSKLQTSDKMSED